MVGAMALTLPMNISAEVVARLKAVFDGVGLVELWKVAVERRLGCGARCGARRRRAPNIADVERLGHAQRLQSCGAEKRNLRRALRGPAMFRQLR